MKYTLRLITSKKSNAISTGKQIGFR